MKTLVNISLIGVLFLSLGACQDGKENKRETYQETMNEVLALHDTLMKKMTPLNKSLQRLDTLEEVPDEEKKELVTKLENSHKSMMQWMQDFGKKFPNALNTQELSPEEMDKKLPALKEEKETLEDMTEKMKENISSAERFLENH